MPGSVDQPSNEARADRLAGLAEWARIVGRPSQADRFLLLAWGALDGGDPAQPP